jgi:hypothetical protein
MLMHVYFGVKIYFLDHWGTHDCWRLLRSNEQSREDNTHISTHNVELPNLATPCRTQGTIRLDRPSGSPA